MGVRENEASHFIGIGIVWTNGGGGRVEIWKIMRTLLLHEPQMSNRLQIVLHFFGKVFFEMFLGSGAECFFNKDISFFWK